MVCECVRKRLFVFLCSPDVERVGILLLTYVGDCLWSDDGGRWFIGNREQPVTTLWWEA